MKARMNAHHAPDVFGLFQFGVIREFMQEPTLVDYKTFKNGDAAVCSANFFRLLLLAKLTYQASCIGLFPLAESTPAFCFKRAFDNFSQFMPLGMGVFSIPLLM